MNYPQSFQDLVDCFKRLPGIGGKSGERLAYYILSMDKSYVEEFSDSIKNIQESIHYCVIYVKIKTVIRILFVLLRIQKMFLQWRR